MPSPLPPLPSPPEADATAAVHAAYAQQLDDQGQSLRGLLHLRSLCARSQSEASIWRQFGFLLLRFERLEPAREAFLRAVELEPSMPIGWESLASIEHALGRTDQARQCWLELLTREPDDPVALCGLWHLAQESLDWAAAEGLEPRLLAALLQSPQRAARVSRYSLLGCPESWPVELFARLPTHPVQDTARAQRIRATRTSGRLRVGYQSAHFREHATTILAAGLFEAHDRERVETFAFSLGAPCDDIYRRRCLSAFEHWQDCFGLSDVRIAQLMYEADLDVLVDLDADNIGGRAGIATRRPARIQLHFLGHPSTTSVEGLDYFIGDHVTLPAGAEREFREHLLRLPRCYQPNDPKRPLPAPMRRGDVGLPPSGLALCNFNQAWKWRREVFECWVDVLRQCPSASLTLLDPGPQASSRLLETARELGLDQAEQRIRFAPALAPEQHLARLAAFDLALDQWPCGGHTTTADALWVGVPTLTKVGPRFAGRVAASLLHHLGEREWIASDAEDYMQKLLAICQDRRPIDTFKSRWAQRRAGAALYDMQGFARDWEDCLRALHERHEHDLTKEDADSFPAPPLAGDQPERRRTPRERRSRAKRGMGLGPQRAG